MKFYLGTHMPHWLAETDIPLFISRVRLTKRKTFPRALGDWALDSGGFSQLAAPPYEWQLPARDYVKDVNRFADEIGRLQWAAPQDWMCEPWMMRGRTIAEHQRRTVDNYLTIRMIGPDVPVIPVLQGWEPDDYMRCADMYEMAGVDLESAPLVGLGSVCRRQATGEAETVVMRLQPLRLHGFGMKTGAVHRFGGLLASADSLAWSFAGRRRGSCSRASKCANCMHWALDWRDRVLSLPDAPTLWSSQAR